MHAMSLAKLKASAVVLTAVLILALVDRLQGAEELFRAEGIVHCQSVFTIRDFGVGVAASEKAETASR